MKADEYVSSENPFAVRLRTLMKERKCTQQRLADAIGIKRQTISQYADGGSLPLIDKLAAMADYFGVSCDYLMGKNACTTPINEEVQQMTGLSEAAIEALKALNAYTWTFPSHLSMLDTISTLLSTPEGKSVLRLLSDYLYGNYSVGYASDSDIMTKRNGISHVSFELISGNVGQITTIPTDIMRESILISLLKALPDMRNAQKGE